MMDEYRFALSNMTFPDEDELFGIWEVPPAAAVAFAADDRRDPPGPLFEATLPAQPAQAEILLKTQETALRLSLIDLKKAEERLNYVNAGVSFAEIGGPEKELQDAMNAIRFPVSFAADDAALEDKRGIIKQWRAFVTQIDRLISHYTNVKTEIDGKLIGHTAVGWTGDFENYLTDDPDQTSFDLHQKNVHLSLATRTAIVRLLIVISTGTIKLGLRMGVPGAQVFLLPAVYKFVRDVLKELRPLWPQIRALV
jgi:hypothetical protein